MINFLPTNGFPNRGELDIHTYGLEKRGVVQWHIFEHTVLDEVVGLHLLASLQVKAGLVILLH